MPVSSIYQFTNIQMYYLSFNSVDNPQYLLYIPGQALLSVIFLFFKHLTVDKVKRFYDSEHDTVIKMI